MPPELKYAGLKRHAKVQSFRFGTMLLAWALLVVTFLCRPQWIRDGMRAGTRAIEAVGDSLPSSRGAQAEVILRELGGFLWIQIMAVIFLVRFVFWLIGVALRRCAQ
ncbi:MAG: hypothetical protein JWQ24_2064 [Tardiphaga sp.]|nr:hypothetical protein [Tardiphaga sp.]